MSFDITTNFGCYMLTFIGAIIEGESFIIGISALCSGIDGPNIYIVFLIAFFTTVLFDQLTFTIGRLVGVDFIIRGYPRFTGAINKIFRMVEKNDTFLILIFRFVWGIRFITPIVIGASRVSYKKYALLNIVAALIWAIILCAVGYFLGDLANSMGFNIKMFSLYITLFFISISLGMGLISKYKRKKNGQ